MHKEELKNRVSEVLYYIWDPIGVNDLGPASRGEYESYTPEVMRAIVDGGTAKEVADLLYMIETQRMELDGRMGNCESAANLLLQWASALKSNIA